MFDFFNGLTPTQIANIAKNIKRWQYVDGIDFDIEPAEGGGNAYYPDVIRNKIVPLAKAIKAAGRPVTTTSDGVFANESAKCHMPYWFSNLQGCVGANLITSMYYPSTIGSQSVTYANYLTQALNNRNTSMASLFPASVGQALYRKDQVALGLTGSSFKPPNASDMATANAAKYNFISVWAITPSQTVCGWSPKKCI